MKTNRPLRGNQNYQVLLFRNKWLGTFLGILLRLSSGVAFFTAVWFLLSVVYLFGFDVDDHTRQWILRSFELLVWIFFIAANIRIFFGRDKRGPAARVIERIVYILLAMACIPTVFRFSFPLWKTLTYIPGNDYFKLALLSVVSFFEFSKAVVLAFRRRTNPSLMLAVSFLAIMLLGSLLLMLPNATYHRIGYIDSLFVSASAVCVTGLIPFDLSSTFTPVGQTVIILLIQTGGLGLMTITSFFGLFFTGNSSIFNQVMMKDMLSSDSMGSLLRTLLYILGVTVFVELVGALLIWNAVHGTLGVTPLKEMAFSGFHAVSAFCNAGFSTLEGNLANPLLQGNNSFYIWISLLIIIGGIGFPIFSNFFNMIVYRVGWVVSRILHPDYKRYKNTHIYNLNTRIAVSSTLVLLAGGTLLFALFEWNGVLSGLSLPEKLTQAFFNAVTPRTAGFNSFDVTAFTMPSIVMICLLMWIGGGSQSTAGGIKVNTFAVALLNIAAVVRGKSRIEVFGREVSQLSVRRASITIILSLLLLFTMFLLLTVFEPDIDPDRLLFECISALGTVGLSMDTTPYLGTEAKVIVIVLMFIGRVGFLTLLIGLVRQVKTENYAYPQDTIIIN